MTDRYKVIRAWHPIGANDRVTEICGLTLNEAVELNDFYAYTNRTDTVRIEAEDMEYD